VNGRSSTTKSTEVGGVIAILGTGTTLAFAIARQMGYTFDPLLEGAVFTFVTTAGGYLARTFQHRLQYGRWR
jgi:hypothetical protein